MSFHVGRLVEDIHPRLRDPGGNNIEAAIHGPVRR